ncbi:MAG: hypothetical protein VW874_07330, partial [Gammaproteobacteria bacterium]
MTEQTDAVSEQPEERVLSASAPAAVPNYDIDSADSDVNVEMPDYRKFNTSPEQNDSSAIEMVQAEATSPATVEMELTSEPTQDNEPEQTAEVVAEVTAPT